MTVQRLDNPIHGISALRSAARHDKVRKNSMTHNKILIIFLYLSPWMALCQSGVTGQAPVTLLQVGTDCAGYCVTVDVRVDLTGLSGSGLDAGLNSFVLAFDLNRSDVFASTVEGDDPFLAWSIYSTSRNQVNTTNRLVLVGVVADSAAPNQNYHVCQITLCGSAGPVIFSLVESESSLGSRVADGDGPGPISILAPAPYQASITTHFPLIWNDALPTWLTDNTFYNLVPPSPTVNCLDLVKLVNCGQP